jgi:CHASE2 domain-containing sensor protein
MILRYHLCLLLFVFKISTGGCQKQNILLVNVANLERPELARLISHINSNYQPAVVAIDFIIRDYEHNSDSILAATLANTPKLVMALQLTDVGQGITMNVRGHHMYYPVHAKKGFSNQMMEDDLLNTVKKFQLYSEGKFESFVSPNFAVEIAKCVDSVKTLRFIKDHSNTINIDYKDGKRCFQKIDADDLLNGTMLQNKIRNKIVIIGETIPDDKYVVPIYDKKLKTMRKMDGIEIIANIVAQILE